MSPEQVPELSSLRLLIAVSRTGSIGEAARLESISQPAASKRIARLEQTMEIPLVRRSTRGSQLTSEGEVFTDWARRVVETVDHMLGAVTSLRAHGDTDLRVAASMTIAEHLVPAWLFELRTTHPDLHVGLRVANSNDVQELVLNEGVDIGFVETPKLDRRLASKQVARDRLAVVVPPNHPWARRSQPLQPRDLGRTPLVVREPGSGTRETLDRLLTGTNPAEPLLELGSNAAVRGAVIAGAGAAAISLLAVSGDLDAGRLVEVRVADVNFDRPLRAVWPRMHRPTGPSAALLHTAIRTNRRREG